MVRKQCVSVLAVIGGLWIPQLAVAAWPGDPTVNVPVCTASNTQAHATMVGDGSDR